MFMLRQTSVKMALLLHKQASDRFHSLLTISFRKILAELFVPLPHISFKNGAIITPGQNLLACLMSIPTGAGVFATMTKSKCLSIIKDFLADP